MRRLCNIALCGLFALGVLVYPALHRMHCGDAGSHFSCRACEAAASHAHSGGPVPRSPPLAASAKACPAGAHEEHGAPTKHDVEHCPICQLALTPMALSVPAILPTPSGIPTDHVFLSSSAPLLHVGHLLPFSRGPPA